MLPGLLPGPYLKEIGVLFDQTIDSPCTEVAQRAKSIKIQHVVFQELLLGTMVRMARAMDSTEWGKLRELQHELTLVTKEMVGEAAAFEDVSFDEEAKILEASIANLNFVFEEAWTRLQKLHSTNSCSPAGAR